MYDHLIPKIKEILLSSPLDIYSDEDDTINEANYSLVNTRFDEDSLSEEDRYVGSANMFIAASLICYDCFDFLNISDLTEEQLDEFYSIWRDIVATLKKERFIREIGLLSKNNLKIVVDNTKLP
jgi:hypothetical protein